MKVFSRIPITWSEYRKWEFHAQQELLSKLKLTQSQLLYRFRKRCPNRYYKNNFGFELTYSVNDTYGFNKQYVVVHDPKKVFMFQLKFGLSGN